MRRAEVVRLLTEHRQELAARGVASLSLYGTGARDEADPDSDIDVLVEFNRPVGFFAFIGIQEYPENLLGSTVDLGALDAIKERIRPAVMRDLVHVY